MLNPDQRNAGAAIGGTWLYRSYLNEPDVVAGVDPAKALSLLFGEGVMTFNLDGECALIGAFGMGCDVVLDLTGTVSAPGGPEPVVFHAAGIGTPTDSWEYDYVGYLAETWLNGTAQVPAMAGTVIRAKPHGTGKAGVTASFIAVRKS